MPDEDTIRQDPYAALRCVQPLAKRTFQTEAEAHLADNVPQSARIANCTGGSTGEPVRFFMTRAQVESYEAARWRGLGWYGITQGSRSVMLWGSPIELSQQAQLKNRIKESLLKNRQILSAYHLSEQELAKQVTFLNRYKPEYLYGYASILTAFAQMMERRGLSLKITLKAVVSTSETLEPWQEQLLGRVFRCPVANEYGRARRGNSCLPVPGGVHAYHGGKLRDRGAKPQNARTAGRGQKRRAGGDGPSQFCPAAAAVSAWGRCRNFG